MPVLASICALVAALQVASYQGTRVWGPDQALDAASASSSDLTTDAPSGSTYTYGETASDPSSQYNGRVYDPETGFLYYGARYYWPQLGRFASADTYEGNPADPASLNRFGYVNNNPYKYTDPSGHCPWCAVGAAIGGVAGAGGGVWYAIDHGYSWKSGKFWASVGAGAGSGALVGGTMGLAGTALAGGGGAAAAGSALAGEGTAAANVIQQAEAATPEVEAAGANVVQQAQQVVASVDANRLSHIFGQARHNLGPLVEAFGGSREKAFGALQEATQSLVTKQGLTEFTKGIVVQVQGLDVTVRGTVVEYPSCEARQVRSSVAGVASGACDVSRPSKQ